MKAPLLALIVPCVVLAACNRADTPAERSDMRESPTSAPGAGPEPGTFGVDQNGNATLNPNTGVTGQGTGTPGTGTSGTDAAGGTNTSRPDGGSADDARRNQ